MMYIAGSLALLGVYFFGNVAKDLTCEDFKRGTFYIEAVVMEKDLRYDIAKEIAVKTKYKIHASPGFSKN